MLASGLSAPASPASHGAVERLLLRVETGPDMEQVETGDRRHIIRGVPLRDPACVGMGCLLPRSGGVTVSLVVSGMLRGLLLGLRNAVVRFYIRYGNRSVHDCFRTAVEPSLEGVGRILLAETRTV